MRKQFPISEQKLSAGPRTTSSKVWMLHVTANDLLHKVDLKNDDLALKDRGILYLPDPLGLPRVSFPFL